MRFAKVIGIAFMAIGVASTSTTLLALIKGQLTPIANTIAGSTLQGFALLIGPALIIVSISAIIVGATSYQYARILDKESREKQ